MKYLYHATATENKESILKDGIKPNNFEHAVFLADSFDSAASFLAIRLINKITVFKVRYTNNQFRKLTESFDHNPNYFKCKAYMDSNVIEPKRFVEVVDLEF